ncbi:High-affinity heme uptake system protein IsdE [Myxococcaceae bacterium]|jgi:ABC-type Fe3+-hydroxamate transport system substrate-binding protein|nr:High-affinity heme uptake system protein IsdE [Myxococcaceae bacterium]
MKPVLLLLAVLACALGAAPAPAEPSKAAAPRVATFCPFVTDALAAAAGRVEIVASVRRSPSAPVADGVADLGTPHTPNTEVLAASRAEIVVVDAVMHAALVPKLEAQGFEVMRVDTTSVDGAFAGILEVAKRTGTLDTVGAEVERARSSLVASRSERPERVLALMGTPSSFFVMTRRTWQGDLLERLGYVNLGADASGDSRAPGFAPLSDEVLAGLEPDRVLLVAHGDVAAVKTAFERRMQERGIWRDAGTGALPPVVVLPPERFLANPGLGIADVAREIVAAGGATPSVATPPAGAGS